MSAATELEAGRVVQIASDVQRWKKFIAETGIKAD